jgi:predicted transcriptional regulator
MKTNSKRTVIVQILRILHNYTSPEHTVTQTAIVNYLDDIDVPCSRKTVGRNLKYLMDIGVPIKRKNVRNGGYYYDFDDDVFFVRIKKNDLSIYNMNSVEDYNELQKYKKADVQIQLYIKLNNVIKIENISVKKANRGANFNQVDKRPVSEYQKMWGFNDKIANLLKLFTGEIIEKNNYNYSKTPKRLFLYDFSLLEQEKIIAFFKQNKVRVVADIIKGRGGFSADWVLVCQTEKDSELKNWKLAEINQVLNFLCQGDVKVSPKGSLNIGEITMQRKGGTPDPTSLQFKINPLDLFLID